MELLILLSHRDCENQLRLYTLLFLILKGYCGSWVKGHPFLLPSQTPSISHIPRVLMDSNKIHAMGVMEMNNSSMTQDVGWEGYSAHPSPHLSPTVSWGLHRAPTPENSSPHLLSPCCCLCSLLSLLWLREMFLPALPTPLPPPTLPNNSLSLF